MNSFCRSGLLCMTVCDFSLLWLKNISLDLFTDMSSGMSDYFLCESLYNFLLSITECFSSSFNLYNEWVFDVLHWGDYIEAAIASRYWLIHEFLIESLIESVTVLERKGFSFIIQLLIIATLCLKQNPCYQRNRTLHLEVSHFWNLLFIQQAVIGKEFLWILHLKQSL